MRFFDYIYYRSYISLVNTKNKHNAEPRSVALVTFLQIAILGALMMIVFKFTGFYDNVQISKGDSHSLKYLISLPLVFIFWHLNEKYYKKKSKDDYLILRKKFKNSAWNKFIPLWLIILSPFILIFGTPFILSLIK